MAAYNGLSSRKYLAAAIPSSDVAYLTLHFAHGFPATVTSHSRRRETQKALRFTQNAPCQTKYTYRILPICLEDFVGQHVGSLSTDYLMSKQDHLSKLFNQSRNRDVP